MTSGDGSGGVERCRAAAIAVLRRSATADGLVASAALPHYTSLWTRDLAFSAIGANICGDAALAAAAGRGLVALAQVQAGNGQIPNAYWPRAGYWDFHESGSTDATALFIIAAAQHLGAHPDPSLRESLWPHLAAAHSWLTYQAANQLTLIDSPMGGDWMDSTLQRSGKLLYVNVLYLRASRGMAELTPADPRPYGELCERLTEKINILFWPEPGAAYASLLEGIGQRLNPELGYPHPVGPTAHAAAARRDREHYVSHVEGCRWVDECDVLGNVLAVLYDVCDRGRARLIMEFLQGGTAGRPYPARSYTRSFAAGDRWGMYKSDLDAFQDERWRNRPGSYHNGGVWPFIGGLYVAALQRVGMDAAAGSALLLLTEANRLSRDGVEWGFHEWIHADTGEPSGAPQQSWNAGTYILAADVVGGAAISL